MRYVILEHKDYMLNLDFSYLEKTKRFFMIESKSYATIQEAELKVERLCQTWRNVTVRRITWVKHTPDVFAINQIVQVCMIHYISTDEVGIFAIAGWENV
jgi:hypothetical protein